MDLGQSRRGVDMGPSALRSAGLQAAIKKLGVTVEDIGNMEVKQPEEMSIGEKRAKYLQEIAETCRDIAKTVEKSLHENFFRWFSAATIPSPPASPQASPAFTASRKKTSATSGSTPTAI